MSAHMSSSTRWIPLSRRPQGPHWTCERCLDWLNPEPACAVQEKRRSSNRFREIRKSNSGIVWSVSIPLSRSRLYAQTTTQTKPVPWTINLRLDKDSQRHLHRTSSLRKCGKSNSVVNSQIPSRSKTSAFHSKRQGLTTTSSTHTLHHHGHLPIRTRHRKV